MARPTLYVLLLTSTVALAGCGGSGGATPGPTDCVPPVIGHRGEPAVAPEETIASFTAAIDDGARTIEGDVQFTKDGQPVLMHDDTVDRTTDGTGPIASKTIAQVESLDAGGWMGNEWKGVRVPTLDAVLQLTRDRGVHVVLELKQEGTTRTQLRTFLTDLRRARMLDRTLVESFHAGNLKAVRSANSAVQTALITKRPVTPKRAASLGQAVIPEISLATAARVRAWQRAGLKVYPWTADSSSQWSEAARAGVDGVLTNRTADYVAWARQQCRLR